MGFETSIATHQSTPAMMAVRQGSTQACAKPAFSAELMVRFSIFVWKRCRRVSTQLLREMAGTTRLELATSAVTVSGL